MSITGIILAGGKSQRMGQDKGLMLLNKRPLVTYAIEALTSLVDEIIIVAHDEAYAQFGHKVVADLIPESGPLGGIYTGLKHSQNDINLVLSCDTPFVSTDLFKHLITQVKGYEAIVPRHRQNIEPLAAIYHSGCLPGLTDLIQKGDLKMRHAVRQLNTLEVDITQHADIYKDYLFDNINTPEAMKEAEQRLRIR